MKLRNSKEMIIDSHSHLSILDEKSTWDETFKKLCSDLAKNKIDRSVLIADNVADSNTADTKRLLEMTDGKKEFLVVGSISPETNSVSELAYFDQLLDQKKIIALKIFPGHDHFYANEVAFEPTIKLCLKHRVPLIVHTGINTGDTDCAKYNNPVLIAEVAKKYPDLKIIIAHFFWPKIDYCFETTIKLPNIYYDTSALADEEVLGLSGGIEKMKTMLEKTLANKPEGVIFGVDYPLCDFGAHIDLIKSLKINEEAKQNVFHLNAERLFGLSVGD